MKEVKQKRAASGAPAAGEAVHDRFSTDEIFQRIVATADEELRRPLRLLFFSGLAAGIAMAIALIPRAAIIASDPNSMLNLHLSHLFYLLGFVIVVMGRYQLFTENTLSPVTLVLARLASIPTLLRIWALVLVANLLGAAATAFLLCNAPILAPEAFEQMMIIGHHAVEGTFWHIFSGAVMAGVFVATMVWLIHAAREAVARLFIVLLVMFVVPAAGLPHCIAGAAELFVLLFEGEIGAYKAFVGFLLPAILGNTLGGVLFVAVLNFAQTSEARFPQIDRAEVELGWKDWLLGTHEHEPYLDGIDHGPQ